ncbi:hypothetical protein QFZ31_004509 [Neobacillus niacini]|nr:hypothetical protein [Neobacillus niacini]
MDRVTTMCINEIRIKKVWLHNSEKQFYYTLSRFEGNKFTSHGSSHHKMWSVLIFEPFLRLGDT